MASIENVTASRLITCDIEGVGDVLGLVRTVTIKESVCSPHLTGEILLLDNDNMIVASDIQGGSLCNISFDGAGQGSGPAYTVDMYVLHIVGTSSPENFNLKIYTISVVSSEYFTDRGQTVSTHSSPGVTGVQMVSEIWSQCGFKTPLSQPAQDMPVQDNTQPLHIQMAKPFTAIGQIRDIQVYPDHTGNVMFFRDRKSVVHAPLKVIYGAASGGGTEFIQRETWGVDYKHLFGAADKSYHSIISINEQSRDVMLDPDELAPDKQILRASDQNAGKMGANKFLSGLAQGAGMNVPATSSERVEAAHDPYNIIAPARWYAHCMKAVPPKYLVRVPLKTGLNITAGGGCTLSLQPTRIKDNPHSGAYFITDLVHEVHNDLREVNGTTTFNALKTGYC